VVISIAGKKHWLWRAVDQDGYVLDELVQSRRNTKATKRLLTQLMKKQGMAPKRIIADKLRSYGAARRQRDFSFLGTVKISLNVLCSGDSIYVA
jgi:putative transposase